MTGNEQHLKHSVGIILKELHAFARATDAPPGENVYRWAEAKADEVARKQAATPDDTQVGIGPLADEPKAPTEQAEGAVVGLRRTDVQRLMHPVLQYLRERGVHQRIAEEASERAVDAAYRGIVAQQAPTPASVSPGTEGE